jgi:hypothetical protein
MVAVPFDTPKIARALRDNAHFTPEPAEGRTLRQTQAETA